MMAPENGLISYPGDLFVSALDLWLDPGHVKKRAFVSHAHADHTGRHKSIIASLPTARLIEHRLQVSVDHALDYDVRTPVKQGYLTLYPSGHILGSAQALIEAEGERLVYTGDFKLKPSRTAEPCQVVPCDHLVMECTYGRPHYRFPDREQVESDLLTHIGNLLGRGHVPVLFTYMLGRAQEMLKLLLDAGFRVALEERTFEMTRIYEELGISFGAYEPFNTEDFEGRVLLFPPHLWKSPVVKRITNRRTVAVTGWAVDGRQDAWYSTDKAFPLSDHADFDDLLRYIELVKPKTVTIIHGFEEFADHIRRMGIKTHLIANLLS